MAVEQIHEYDRGPSQVKEGVSLILKGMSEVVSGCVKVLVRSVISQDSDDALNRAVYDMGAAGFIAPIIASVISRYIGGYERPPVEVLIPSVIPPILFAAKNFVMWCTHASQGN